ncbi:site-specific DNA-methyltransferase [Agreia pratensis]|uniref:site-specific DNA-methyltransferase (cytosine-N(4)-specific) n=1 Tax=Agreia pratensis TaxID=150121 RepID=A0A1X7KSN1_9MICO|nr:site-specific DNA-methyltransferase [Agreia pratensis]SMG44498.1 Putative RNA methylase family UPF0020 [Agreia pratensis]
MGARTIHPFPARMAPEIATDYLKVREVGNKTALSILDPMCGSGTVLSVAAERGHNAIGFDVDPLAVMMTRVATRPIATDPLLDQAERLVAAAQASTRKKMRWEDKQTQAFAKFWFGDKQRVALNRLSLGLDLVEDEAVRETLQIALSRIIVTKSPKASLAADTSHSRPHRTIQKSTYDVYDGFLRSVKELTRLLDKRAMPGSAKAFRGDSRGLADVPNNSVDLAITSPPYLNAIDYLRGHKLSLIWLGHTIPELRDIRSNSIGAERGLDEIPAERVQNMVEVIKASASDPNALPLPTITRYAKDVCEFADELYRVSRTGAQVIAVVGNSSLKGNFISNDGMVQKAFDDAGFTFQERVERDLPENSRYMPISTSDSASSMAKRMRTEVVLTVKKTT